MKKIFFLSIIVLIFASSSVLAKSSTNPLDKAKEYFENNCNDDKKSGEKSFDCYLYQVISDIKDNPKQLKTYDSNGKELGLYISNDTFFYTPANKFVTVDETDRSGIYISPGYRVVNFDQLDCIGSGYIQDIDDLSVSDISNRLFPAYNGKFYALDGSIDPITKDLLRSHTDYAGNCVNGDGIDMRVWKFKEVPTTLGRSAKLPLIFKYQ